jgi:hypothetical protein
MRTGFWRWAAALVGLMAGAPAMAQQAGNPLRQDQDIIVSGRQERTRVLVAETRAITDATDGLIARFETPVCPAATGLPRDHAAVIVARIRRLAGEIGLQAGPAGCKPNLTVTIAGNAVAYIDALRRRRPLLFASMEISEINALRASPGPAWAWRTIEVQRSDGGATQRISQLNGRAVSSRRAVFAQNVPMSRLGAPVRQEIMLSFVVLSADAVEGFTLTQIADYAATAGLAPIDPRGGVRLSHASILAMFEDRRKGASPAEAATPFDIAYLTSLYQGAGGLSSDQQSAEMAARMREMLDAR